MKVICIECMWIKYWRSGDGLVDEKNKVIVRGAEKRARLMTYIGQEIEPDDADPSGGESAIEFFSDEFADLGFVGAFHFQHFLDDASDATLGLVGHV
jgi:hypothetical protein